MTAWDAVHAKRAVRTFAERPLDPADLDRILEAGRRAHSAKNLQRWTFIVVRDRDRLRALSALGPWAGHVAGAAVAVALITPDPHDSSAPLSVMWDLGGAAAQMMLVAWELGVGSCPATVYEPEHARELLGYPADMHCEYILSFGYPRDPSILTRPNRPGGRRPAETLVHEDHWRADAATDNG
jgi:nitroreductase